MSRNLVKRTCAILNIMKKPKGLWTPKDYQRDDRLRKKAQKAYQKIYCQTAAYKAGQRAAQKIYRLKNKKKIAAYFRRWYIKNKPHKNAKSRAWNKKHPARAKHLRIKNTYGLSPSEYKQLIARGCAICGARATHIDHNHLSGKVRAALCRGCNIGLGHFSEDESFLMSAAKYIKKHRV